MNSKERKLLKIGALHLIASIVCIFLESEFWNIFAMLGGVSMILLNINDTSREEELEKAIREHRNKSVGHGACWENDWELWMILANKDDKNEALKIVTTPLPKKEDFLSECEKYYEGQTNIRPKCWSKLNG